MISSYKDILKAHIMLSLTGSNNMSLQTYVTQLIQEHSEERSDILAAYHAVKNELVFEQVS